MEIFVFFEIIMKRRNKWKTHFSLWETLPQKNHYTRINNHQPLSLWWVDWLALWHNSDENSHAVHSFDSLLFSWMEWMMKKKNILISSKKGKWWKKEFPTFSSTAQPCQSHTHTDRHWQRREPAGCWKSVASYSSWLNAPSLSLSLSFWNNPPTCTSGKDISNHGTNQKNEKAKPAAVAPDPNSQCRRHRKSSSFSLVVFSFFSYFLMRNSSIPRIVSCPNANWWMELAAQDRLFRWLFSNSISLTCKLPTVRWRLASLLALVVGRYQGIFDASPIVWDATEGFHPIGRCVSLSLSLCVHRKYIYLFICLH